jgi:hypothetical protein
MMMSFRGFLREILHQTVKNFGFAAAFGAIALSACERREKELPPTGLPSPPPVEASEPEITRSKTVRESGGRVETQRRADPRIASILEGHVVPLETARKLVGLVPVLPEAAREEAVGHAVHLVEDAEYRSVLGPLLRNPSLGAAPLQTLFNDLLNRSDAVKLRELRELMGVAGHPMAAEAREVLSVAVGGDHGADLGAWDAAIARQLAKGSSE